MCEPRLTLGFTGTAVVFCLLHHLLSNRNIDHVMNQIWTLSRNQSVIRRAVYRPCACLTLTASRQLASKPAPTGIETVSDTNSVKMAPERSSPKAPSIPWSTMNQPISKDGQKQAKPPAPPSPSASIILISQSNRVLLLHRKKTSSSFPSAHVFPGGNLEPSDGEIASDSTDPARHKDNLAYRTGAIRELFEESGILLARESSSSEAPLLTLDQDTRMAGRNDVHSGKTTFRSWLSRQSATAHLDTESLIPFTHWVTPTNVPKRFTTQMYVYFVPVTERRRHLLATADEVETMAPEWATAAHWIERARSGEIILFPPQFILLHLVSNFLDRPGQDPASPRDVPEDERVRRREALRRFIEQDASPVPWTDKYISPTPIGQWKDGRNILNLEKPGVELAKSGLKGDSSRVVLVRFQKEGPREVDVMMKKDVQDELSKQKAKI